MELFLHDVSESHHGNGGGGDGGSGHLDGEGLLVFFFLFLFFSTLSGWLLWGNPPVGNRFSSDKGPGHVGEGVSVGGLSSDIPSRGVRFLHNAREGSSDGLNSIVCISSNFVLVDGGEAVVRGLLKSDAI